jgi:glycosyltransferase involved in cell wall biosynthesis
VWCTKIDDYLLVRSVVVIDAEKPDYLNTPASDGRPSYHYASKDTGTPLVSIITPYYNAGPVFLETVRCVERMSYPHWEWIIVDDGSTSAESVAQLEEVAAAERRIQVITQENRGPSVARNRAVAAARGQYLLQLDADDMVEPTFVEKSLWVMEIQRQFAACSAYNVTFGVRPLLWDHGFGAYGKNLTHENFVTSQAMIRRDAFLEAGGYDESIMKGHEDWDFWLNLAEAGLWGYTIPEYLTWYRTSEGSRVQETFGDAERHKAFHAWLLKKHDRLRTHFPRPEFQSGIDNPFEEVKTEAPISNPLVKPTGTKRILLLVPWLALGGADKFNLDLVRMLSQRGYEFTIVATKNADHSWLHEFAHITPDIFTLPNFLQYADYPRFLSYLIESRQIDAVLVANSEIGYGMVPFLRNYHPHLSILDYTHVEEEHWKNGGYPWMSVRLGSQLDLRVTCTHHLKDWMVRRGADPDGIAVVHANIDPNEWDPSLYDTAGTRERLGIDPASAMVLYVGRVVDQKRPLVWAEILRRLARTRNDFTAFVVGDGALLPELKSYVQKHRLQPHVKFLGPLPNKDVRELMAAADILLLPSKYEGLALVLYEALAMETVPVATAYGGHPELLTLDCAFAIPASGSEIDEYTEAMDSLVSDRDRLRSMAAAGRERVVRHFNLEQMANGMERALSRAAQIAANRPGSPDTGLALYSASLTLECERLNVLGDKLWYDLYVRDNAAGAKVMQIRSVSDLVRLVRSGMLPIGTRRYEIYKKLRRSLLRRGNYIDEYAVTVQTSNTDTPAPVVLPVEKRSTAGMAAVTSDDSPEAAVLDSHVERLTAASERATGFEGGRTSSIH